MIIQILQFMYAKGAGEAALRRFVNFALTKSCDEVSESLLSPKEIVNNLSIKYDVAENIAKSYSKAEEIAGKLYKNNVLTLWLGHELYPNRLITTLGESAPPVIFCLGNIEVFKQQCVGFCGSRKASEKGLCITGKCAEQLVQQNICVVSGYAHGVDMSAHKAALKNGGNTLFVLVEGILKFQRKRDVATLLTEKNYLAVSQFPPLLTWEARNAMRRNATIIGLSQAMILVESGLSGGTFAAGEETLKRGQPLFVIDFAAPGPSAEANPYFIDQGGVAIRGNQEGRPNLKKVIEAVRSQSHSKSKITINKNISKKISHIQQGNLLK